MAFVNVDGNGIILNTFLPVIVVCRYYYNSRKGCFVDAERKFASRKSMNNNNE